MGYFDDFQLVNVSRTRMRGKSQAPMILTQHHYLGVMQGEVLLRGAIEKRPLVYFTPRGIRTRGGWDSPDNRWRDNFYIECRGSRADRLFDAVGAVKSFVYFPVPDAAPYIAILNEMKRLYSSGDPLQNVALILCLEEFAAKLERNRIGQVVTAGHQSALIRIMEAVSRNPGIQWNFHQEADKAGVSLRHWNRLFTALAGSPPHRYVCACRLRLARKLLVSGDLPIKEIAGLAGFERVSDFTRFFRQGTGMTPGECRKNRIL